MPTYKFTCGRIDSCGECPFIDMQYDLCSDKARYYCELTDNEIADYMNKPTDCPLVLVKED
jgi:hypothetical protein